jgi:VanZ family protein
MGNKMRKILKWLTPLLAVGGCIFIWHFSLADGERSAATSGEVLKWLNDRLASWGADFRFSQHTVRKTGHFLGYFLLGGFLSFTLWLHEFRHYGLIAFPAVFLAACVDEFIQRFSPGRVSSFGDVLLDTAGGACGILLFAAAVSALFSLLNKRRKKH